MYRNWARYQPDDVPNRDCVVMFDQQADQGRLAGYWNDQSCHEPLPYVCRQGALIDINLEKFAVVAN